MYNWTLTFLLNPSKEGSGTLTLGSGGAITTMTGMIDGKVISLNSGSLPLGGILLNPSITISGATTRISTHSYFTAFTYTPVPEPHEYAMVACAGLVGFGLWRRRSQAASKA